MKKSSLAHFLVVFAAIGSPTFTALAYNGQLHQAPQARPIKLGTSGGNIADQFTCWSATYCASGTLGALVQADGKRYVLSNNHVLGLSNNGTTGDGVTQPGLIDYACRSAGAIANLAGFVELHYDG